MYIPRRENSETDSNSATDCLPTVWSKEYLFNSSVTDFFKLELLDIFIFYYLISIIWCV